MAGKSEIGSIVKCLGCGYDLRSLPKGKCPECGREFDPADFKSFGSDVREVDPRRIRIIIIASLAWPVAMVMLSYAAYCSGYLELGRWPVESLDDPKGFGQPTRGLALIALFVVFFSPYALLATLILLIGPAVVVWEKRNFATALKVLVIPLAGWLILGAYLVLAQGHIVGWMLD